MANPEKLVKNCILTVDHGLYEETLKRLKAIFATTKRILNIKFVKLEDSKMIGFPLSHNQILVLLKNGEYVLFPRGINSSSIREGLGVRYKQVAYWACLPTHNSDANFCGKTTLTNYVELYEETHHD